MSLTPTLDLEPADLNLAIIGGDGLALTLSIDEDLTGYTVDCEVVARASRASVQVVDAQLIQANPAIITLALTGTETAALIDERLDWWLRVTPSGGQPRTLLAGAFHARPL